MRLALCFIATIGWCLALPTSKDVNVAGARIIGGEEMALNSVPYQVAVLINGTGLCGGSLISTTRVLTAAHCTVIASFLELRIGAHYFNQVEPDQVRLTSSSVVVHEDYVRATLENDVSVILLPSAVTLSDAIKTVPLAPATDPDHAGSVALLTGWGLTESLTTSPFLKGVNVTVISNTACAAFFGYVTDSKLCTNGTGPVGACNSDSGGPLVLDGVQIGLVSFGQQPCTAQFPTGFARISSFRDWIETNAGV